jgi:PHD/YefM family antitoxin component YafN of YafNO toxin-antitoxin module
MDARYLTDESGERIGVLLDIQEYERLMEELEELADIRAYDEAMAAIERGADEVIPFEQAMEEIERGQVKW